MSCVSAVSFFIPYGMGKVESVLEAYGLGPKEVLAKHPTESG